jgi:hypothetical protein
MSLLWLWFRAENRHFWNLLEFNLGGGDMVYEHRLRPEFTALMQVQADFRLMRRGWGARARNIIDEADLLPGGQPTSGTTRNTLTDHVLAQGTGPFRLIFQSYHGGGAHAMAAHLHQGVRFMDPNGGEAHFANPEQFRLWLPRYLRRMRYHISYYRVYGFRHQP